MTIKQAAMWLCQPGIVSMIHDPTTKKALSVAVKALAESEHSTNLAEVGTDCISRQQAIDALRGYLVEKRCPDDGTLTCRLIENEVINKLPTIQPKRGRWIKNETTWTGYKCSVCGDVPYMHTCMGKPMYSYCPYCGSYNGGKNEI